jgi:cytochrome c-type biogenesis protein CcmH/NrfG
MKTIDNYIRNNLEKFDTEEPLSGHAERFSAKLKRNYGMISGNIWLMVARVAAVILFGLIISYVIVHEFDQLKMNSVGKNAAISNPELLETEQFYTSQLNIYYKRIQNLGFNNNLKEKKKVLNELSEMDKQVQAMKRDLQQNPDDERIVSAIINFYQLKIEIMDMIIMHTQNTSNSML